MSKYRAKSRNFDGDPVISKIFTDIHNYCKMRSPSQFEIHWNYCCDFLRNSVTFWIPKSHTNLSTRKSRQILDTLGARISLPCPGTVVSIKTGAAFRYARSAIQCSFSTDPSRLQASLLFIMMNSLI